MPPADFHAPPPRRLIVLTGAADACRTAAQALLGGFVSEEIRWLDVGGDGLARLHAGRIPDPATARSPHAALGSECAALVIDAHTGFDPDAVGQAAGALRGGGVLLLLAPALAGWPLHADPLRRRCSVHGCEPAGPDRYLARLARCIASDATFLRIELTPQATPPASATPANGERHLPIARDRTPRGGGAGERGRTPERSAGVSPSPPAPLRQEERGDQSPGAGTPCLRELPICVNSHEGRGAGNTARPAVTGIPPAALPAPPPPAGGPAGVCATADQAAAVAALVRLARGRARRPLVLTADRGRGKSAALGLAAARLLAAGWPRIVVTGPRLDAATAVFAHAAAALPAAQATRGRLEIAGGVLEFVAPDALADAAPVPLLFVDEAAALPAALLARLLAHHPRIAFASTVHGYEGSGRGFALRFRATLDARTPDWRGLTLTTPIRWPADDPVERRLARWLLLDAEPAPDAALAGLVDPAGPDPQSLTIVRIDRDRLVDDEARLAQLHGLLVAAHYRTTPLDLRHLLDGPNLRLYAALTGDAAVAGVLLAAEEGGFDAALATEVHAGRRRPRGHLIPQSLAQHLGVADGAERRCLRIVRIAVHEAVRGRGIGRALLATLADAAARDGFDLLGTSFSAETGVLRFWQAAGLRPVRVGSGHDAASGAPPLMLLRALSAAGQAMLAPLLARFATDLPLRLAGPLSALEAELAAALLAGASAGAGVDTAHDAATVTAFAHGARDWASAWPALWRAAGRALAEAGSPLTPAERALLVAALLQHQPWPALARLIDASGRAAVETRLRQVFARLADHAGPAPAAARGR